MNNNENINKYRNDFYNSIKIKSENSYYVCKENPDKIAFKGKCSFFTCEYMFYDVKGYKSKVLNNPTYKEIFLLCDEMINETGNINDVYFKDIEPLTEYEEIMNNKEPFKNPDKIYNIEIIMIDGRQAFEEYIDNNDIELY